MARVTYEQARADHEYLWAIAPAEDMTGCYVDQEDLRKLLENPTKSTARDCYVSQIEYWFDKGPEHGNGFTAESLISSDDGVRDIAERYGFA